jgi:hypothetical protein
LKLLSIEEGGATFLEQCTPNTAFVSVQPAAASTSTQGRFYSLPPPPFNRTNSNVATAPSFVLHREHIKHLHSSKSGIDDATLHSSSIFSFRKSVCQHGGEGRWPMYAIILFLFRGRILFSSRACKKESLPLR